jgi:hypothetical protein
MKPEEFLSRFIGAHLRCVTAISFNRDSVVTQTFNSSEDHKCAQFIAEHAGKDNLYFSVNPPRRLMTRKPSLADIELVGWLHVDIDFKTKDGSEEELVLERLRSGSRVLRPHVILNSGGGIQAFWRLKEPVLIQDEHHAREIGRLNQRLAEIFQGDKCHDIAHIMRLPGTMNVLNPKKVEAGRKQTMARVLDAVWEGGYPIEEFASSETNEVVPISHTVIKKESISDLSRLPNEVDEFCRNVIIHGHDPSDISRFPSRSEALFFVCCALVKAGVPDSKILGIITDHKFGISSSVLDKKAPNAERYAVRQIERAHQFCISPALQELNDEHAVILNIGGKCRIMSETFDPVLKRYSINYQSFADFKNAYMNRFVPTTRGEDGRQNFAPMGHWWLSSKNRRQYKSVVFQPGRELKDSYNLWRGFAVEPSTSGSCQRFLEHMKSGLCLGKEEHYQYLLRWMAYAVQFPDRPGQIAVVLQGKQGAGKSIYANAFGSLFGRHFLPISDPKHLIGSFNRHLQDCVVLFADEAFYAGDKKHGSILKALITEESLVIEPKGIDSIVSPNYLHLIMASNEQWVVPAALDDRRFFVLTVDDSKVGNFEYFQAIQDELDHGGRERLLYELQSVDLNGFNIRNVPKTEGLRQQQILTMKPAEEWWYEKITRGSLFEDSTEWDTSCPVILLQVDYQLFLRRNQLPGKSTMAALHHIIKSFLGEDRVVKIQGNEPLTYIDSTGIEVKCARPYFLRIPTLDICRKAWHERYPGVSSWLV